MAESSSPQFFKNFDFTPKEIEHLLWLSAELKKPSMRWNRSALPKVKTSHSFLKKPPPEPVVHSKSPPLIKAPKSLI